MTPSTRTPSPRAAYTPDSDRSEQPDRRLRRGQLILASAVSGMVLLAGVGKMLGLHITGDAQAGVSALSAHMARLDTTQTAQDVRLQRLEEADNARQTDIQTLNAKQDLTLFVVCILAKRTDPTVVPQGCNDYTGKQARPHQVAPLPQLP